MNSFTMSFIMVSCCLHACMCMCLCESIKQQQQKTANQSFSGMSQRMQSNRCVSWSTLSENEMRNDSFTIFYQDKAIVFCFQVKQNNAHNATSQSLSTKHNRHKSEKLINWMNVWRLCSVQGSSFLTICNWNQQQHSLKRGKNSISFPSDRMQRDFIKKHN